MVDSMPLFEDNLWRPLGRLIFFLTVFVLLISSCSKKKSFDLKKTAILSSDLGSEIKSAVIPDDVLLKQAKYSDIPLPVGYDFVDLTKGEVSKINAFKSTDKVDLICYSGDLSINQVVEYYRQSMDRCGWEIVDLSNEQEGLLFCNKFSRCCVVSVRDDIHENSNKSYVYLFIKNKFKQDDLSKKDINAKNIILDDTWGFLKKG